MIDLYSAGTAFVTAYLLGYLFGYTLLTWRRVMEKAT